MRTDELDFDLPPELIAQAPVAERAASRLLHYRTGERTIAHRRFSDLPGLLRAGDLLVFNDTRVIPARFALRKSTGGRVEGLFLSELTPGRWHVMLKNAGGAAELSFADAPDVTARTAAARDDGTYEIELSTPSPAAELLARVGRMPLPPYIKREKDHDDRDELDRARYQTVYARQSGSIAAPTAGLHFTDELLRELDDRGIERVSVTLHVGLGTFKPVTAESLEAHQMHSEHYTIDEPTAAALSRAKQQGRRLIAVGTTAARVLESQPPGPDFQPVSAETRIFIHPPYQWRHVGALITNFHLPRSTLIALVAARVGLDEQRRIYREAIEQRYRFFSYGDASFLE